VLQAARADAVPSRLVFLHLLERDPEPVGESLLAHSEHHSAHPDPAAHVFVDGVGGWPPPSLWLFTIPPNDCPSVRALRSGHGIPGAPHWQARVVAGLMMDAPDSSLGTICAGFIPTSPVALAS